MSVGTALLVASVIMLTACNPTIARQRGTVASVRPSGGDVEVCLQGVTDAGSTYGDREPIDHSCFAFAHDAPVPAPGDCVVITEQGEGGVDFAHDDGC